jgi:hypothetical protein
VSRARPDQSWLGLEADCSTCHEDYHGGTLGPRCESCHDTTRFKPASAFNHDATAFRLTGKHTTTPCQRCHLVPGLVLLEVPDGPSRPRFKPVAHEECSSCHEDAHRGHLGPRCSSCHVTDGFGIVDRSRFDHARTRYPLEGRHAAVECASCHDPAHGGSRKPEFGTCSACHTDAHAGTGTLAGKSVDCAACHDERGFDRSTYTVAAHAAARYPLAGHHATVPCRGCHVKRASDPALGPAAVKLRPGFATCRDCHAEAHARQLASRADGGACEACHTVGGWRPSLFGTEQHAAVGLTLAGAHAEAACAACHGPGRARLPALPGPEVLGPARVAFAIGTACETCHFDPHGGHFSAHGARPARGGCTDCHGVTAFRPARVDAALHDTFAYALEGAHRAVPCGECHASLLEPPPRISLLDVAGRSRSLVFTEPHGSCEACHRTPHGDQFDGRPGGCASCHGLAGFRPASRFDHDTGARFPLDGGHRDVPCGKCHPRRSAAAADGRVIYRPLPSDCRDCHTGPELRSPEGIS